VIAPVSKSIPAAEILRQLVAIPTPSAVSNLPLLLWVETFLKMRGWQVEQLLWIDEAGVEKANLIAWPFASEMPDKVELAFVCHADTVPFARDWSGALTLALHQGQLHGCGSCDVKGALACFLAAVSGFESTSISSGVALILTADEEIGCKGMDRLLASDRAGNLRIASAIVSEPTSLRPGVAGKGYGLARVTVEGKEAHSAFPQQGRSAISVAARLISAIEDGMEIEAADALFDPPRTTLNIGVISGGTAKNILAGSCTFLVEWRAIPGEDPSRVLTHIQTIVREIEASEPKVKIRIEGLRAEPGFAPGIASVSSGPLQQRLAARLEGAPVGISFGSEASRVARIADEVIVIGPGDMRTAHSDRECVPIAELELWTRVLGELICAS
jgi:acetylornithine deacetylase